MSESPPSEHCVNIRLIPQGTRGTGGPPEKIARWQKPLQGGLTWFGVIPQPAWHDFITNAKSVSVACLTVAMGAVGLGTSVTQLKILGVRPLLVAPTAMVLVGGVSLVFIGVFAAVL